MPESVMEVLRPQRSEKIIDVVAKAGIDVSPWGVRKDGSLVSNPGTNQTYCYEWAFGGNGQPTALCIWHKSLVFSQDAVFYQGNMRQYALELDRVAIDRSAPSDVRSRARAQAKRARNFDSLLQRAYRESGPVRVIILEGKPRSQPDPGWDASKVRFRTLDPDFWYIHSYSDDGSCRLVRKIPPISIPNGADILPAQPAFVDQFSLPEPVGRHQSHGFAFDRSSEVRRAVLKRAAGVCECCSAPGFKMDNGSVFLETHHVIPLSEKGPDQEWNVVAICPNDHRQAHFAEGRAALRDQLIKHLLRIYPAKETAFRVLLNAVPDAMLTS